MAFDRISVPGETLRYGSTDAEGLWFWKRIVSSVFPRFGDTTLKRLTRRLYRQFEEASAWEVLAGAPEVLEWLRQQGYKLGVVTNWDVRASRLLKDLGLSPYMNEIVVSSEVGYEKPDPQIFKIMYDSMKPHSGNFTMIGNSVKIDLEVPEQMGWQTILHTVESDDSWGLETEDWATVPQLVEGQGETGREG